MKFSKAELLQILTKYVTKPSLIKHAIAVEGVMRYFAGINNFDADYWGGVGLLHDIDYEQFPDEHLQHTNEILLNEGFDSDFIKHILTHGYGICSTVEPYEYMEKVLYTIDELTGLIIACAYVNPLRKLNAVTVESVMKKWNKREFAANVDRSIIEKGANMLNMPLSEVINITLAGLINVADDLGL